RCWSRESRPRRNISRLPAPRAARGVRRRRLASAMSSTTASPRKRGAISALAGGLPESILAAVDRGDPEAAAAGLRVLARRAGAWGLPAGFLAQNAAALASGNWDRLAEPFRRCEFVGAGGTCFLLAPYVVRRRGRELRQLTGIYGRVSAPE